MLIETILDAILRAMELALHAHHVATIRMDILRGDMAKGRVGDVVLWAAGVGENESTDDEEDEE